MRLFVAATVAASLFATSLFAAEAVAPLAPGNPAGIKKAQDAEADNTLWWVVGGAATVGIIAAVASGGDNTPATSGTS